MPDALVEPAGRAVITDASDATTARPRGFLARWWPVMPAAAGRLARSVRAAELSGAACAFWMRALAVLVVSAWLVYSVSWPRDLYYLSIAAAFFVLGYLPYRWRRHRHAEAIKLAFGCLDVVLVTTAILMPPPAGLSVDWPIQTRLRGQEFLYLLLLLAEAALTYSPLRVLWTGLSIALVWTVGVQLVYARPDTTRFADLAGDGPLAMGAILRTYLHPTFVGLTAWWTQVVVTMLFTAILALAVWRARRTLVAQVQAEVVHADLARYVSPDVADALAAQAPSGFGAPVTRTVAVLFADIIGFTAHAAELTPEQTFALLRSFQQRCCRIVFRHGGTLDKFLGDGLMATFGALADEPDAAARAHVAQVWGVDPDELPGPGIPAVALLDALGRPGGPRALLVHGSNPAVSVPGSSGVRERLAALDLLVVCDLVPSETALLADVVLPVTQWAEEEGTMTSLEGRVLRRRAAVRPPAGVRSELWVWAELARRLGAPGTWSSDPAEVFDELARASAGGVADYSGLSHARLDAAEASGADDGGTALHWPCPATPVRSARRGWTSTKGSPAASTSSGTRRVCAPDW